MNVHHQNEDVSDVAEKDISEVNVMRVEKQLIGIKNFWKIREVDHGVRVENDELLLRRNKNINQPV